VTSLHVLALQKISIEIFIGFLHRKFHKVSIEFHRVSMEIHKISPLSSMELNGSFIELQRTLWRTPMESERTPQRIPMELDKNSWSSICQFSME
jgi:hypothetical protein